MPQLPLATTSDRMSYMGILHSSKNYRFQEKIIVFRKTTFSVFLAIFVFWKTIIFSILLKLSFSGKNYRFLENDNSFLKTTFFCKMEKIIVFGKTRTFFLKTTLFSKMEKLSFFGKRELFFGGDNVFKSTILIYPTFFRADTISCHPVRLRVLYCNRNLSNYC